MDQDRFDILTRSLRGVLPRRAVVRGLFGAGCGLAALPLSEAGAAKRKKKKRKKRKPLPQCDVCRSGCAFTTVQAAIDAANPGATIRLCPGTYREHATVSKNLTLVGAGAERSILDGGGTASGTAVLTILSGATVDVRALTVTGGNGGGGIANVGALILDNVDVTANKSNEGGGIYTQDGELTLIDSRVSGNEAGNQGGGLYVESGTVTLNESHVTANKANGAGSQGGGFYIFSGTVTLNGTRVTGNTAASGGGIYKAGSATVTIEPESVTGNTPDNCAGQAVGNCVN